MDVQTAKLELVKRILSLDDERLIQGLLDLISPSEESPKLSATERAEIQLGLKQLDARKRIPLDEFLKKVS